VIRTQPTQLTGATPFPDCVVPSRSIEQGIYTTLYEEVAAHLGATRGQECLLTSIDLLKGRTEAELQAHACSSSLADSGDDPVARMEGGEAQQYPRSQGQGSVAAGRRIIWFHHIKSVKKRKHIVEWAHELRLGGWVGGRLRE